MDVGVLVEGGVGGGDYGVPDYGFGWWGCGGGEGGVGGFYPEEDLFCVPVEEGGQVGCEVEGYVRVFFAFGGVVVWAAFRSVNGVRMFV